MIARSDLLNFLASRPDYEPTDVVVFVGNSADAMEDAKAIQALQDELQLECFTKNEDKRLRPFRLVIYHWRQDAGTHGGQEQINRVIDQADLAVFPFRIKSGEVTRDEVERCRGRGIEIFACFPKIDSLRFASPDDARCYLETDEYKKQLGTGEGWKATPTKAITLEEDYSSSDELLGRAKAWIATEVKEVARKRVDESRVSAPPATSAAEATSVPNPTTGPDDVVPTPAPAFHFVRKPYVEKQGFAGRFDELALIDDWATGPGAMLLFQAIGGMGKSMLTWHWLNNYAPKVRADWAGRLWYSFYEQGADLHDFLVHALAYIRHQPPSAFRKRRTLDLGYELRQELDAQPWLLIMDGLERVLVAYNRAGKEHMSDEDAEVIRDGMGLDRAPRACFRPEDDDVLAMLAQAGRGKLLVSSRLTPTALTNDAQQPIPGVRHVALEGLAPEDAEQVLRTAGVRGDGWHMRRYLHDNFECHPLSVGVVAGHVVNFQEARGDFDRWVESPKGGADPGLTTGKLRGKQNHILSRAFDDLDADHKALLGSLAMATIELTPEVIQVLNPMRPIEPKKVEAPRELTDADAESEIFDPFTLLRIEKMASHRSLIRERDEAKTPEARATAEKELEAYCKQEFVKQKERYDAYLAAHAAWQQKASAADAWLERALPDLEARGLLQFDATTGTLDMHPAIRHTALLGLSPEIRSTTGSHVSDALSSRPAKPFEEARTRDDLALAITRVEALNAAGKLEEGLNLCVRIGLRNALARLTLGHDWLEMLRPYFSAGWNNLNVLLPETVHARTLRDASHALDLIGSYQESLLLCTKALRLVLWQGSSCASILGDLSVCFYRLGKIAVERRILSLGIRMAEAESDWIQSNRFKRFELGYYVTSGHMNEARSRLDGMRLALQIGDVQIDDVEKVQVLRWELELAFRTNCLEQSFADECIQKIRELGLRWEELHSLNVLVNWHDSNERHESALVACNDLIALANDVGAPGLSAYETRRALSLVALGRLDAARRIAARVDQGKKPPHVELALLYLALGDHAKARTHAREGYKNAWGEGPPYHHHWDLLDCRRVLAAVGEPEPKLTPFDPAKVEPFDFEPAVERLIEKKLAEKAERETKAAERAAARAKREAAEATPNGPASTEPAHTNSPAAVEWTVLPDALAGANFVKTHNGTHVFELTDGRFYIDAKGAVATLEKACAKIDERA